MRTQENEWTLPFDNGGYLKGDTLFDILVRKDNEALERLLGRRDSDMLSYDELLEAYKSYLATQLAGLTPEEKRRLELPKEYGGIDTILKHTGWDLELSIVNMPDTMKKQVVVKAGYTESGLKELDFIDMQSSEAESIIRRLVLTATGRELTGACPEITGRQLYACRPPKGDWCIYIKRRRIKW